MLARRQHLRGTCRRANFADPRTGGQGVLSVGTRLIPAMRSCPWQMRHCSSGRVARSERASQNKAPLVCMWSIAAGLSWQAEHAAAIGVTMSVVDAASVLAPVSALKVKADP